MSAMPVSRLEAMRDSRQGAAAPELVGAAQDVLAQGLELLFKLTDGQYASVARAPFNASIGGHFRHVLEHFHCLFEGAASGVVNYDARKRNARIENEVTFASIATCDVLRSLKKWDDAVLGHPCKTVSSVAYQSQAAATIESNVGRELAYCIGHAIHHYAIIRLICSEVRAEVPGTFGYAPSTLKHQSSLAVD